MRLVDGEQGDPLQRGEAVEQGEETLAQQALGRDINQVEFALQQPAFDGGGGCLIERGIEEGGAHAGLQQRIDLILHQCDQRRDHHADPWP